MVCYATGTWSEQLLPLPYPITETDMRNPLWLPGIDGLKGAHVRGQAVRAFLAYEYSDALDPGELNTDTRLIGRSVWNTRWLLVIPGATLLNDPEVGIERFMQDVDNLHLLPDIRLRG